MPDIIRLLPDSVANQIAAGEVIQRPASVIKELVENAIDAGATSIQIILKDGGRALIQVIDNGSGMSDTDARLAFERHSTSKIQSADDLFALHTMGFRGEALASIAAIAQVELRTRRRGAEIGTRLCISASRCETQEADLCAEGSNFMIKNIFFNVPARRKFLKSKQVELSNIVREFERLALVNHTTEFSLTNDDNVMYKLMPGDSLKKRIAALFSRSIEQQLITIETSTSIVTISGFVGRPENARRRGALQYFFVNGRHMKHPYFHKAILNCYDQLIPADSQPNYFVNFSVDPSTIDINIHPTKNEIKFENEQAIWQILFAAVKEALGKFSAVPSIDFDTEGMFQIDDADALSNHTGNVPPPIDINPEFNPFNSDSHTGATQQPRTTYRQESAGYTKSRFGADDASLQNWDELYSSFESKRTDAAVQTIEGRPLPTETITSSLFNDEADQPTMPCFQFADKYIVTPHQLGLLVIDQHRAHIRILFDRLMAEQTGNSESQRVLFPDIVELTPAQTVIFNELQPQLEECGFDVSFLGSGSWTVNSIPAALKGMNIKEFIHSVVDSVETGGKDVGTRIREIICLSSARAAAISSGQRLSQAEMTDITSKLFACAEQRYTPDGKTIIHSISKDDLAKLFG